MNKNTGSLVCAIIGAVFGLIGGILWAACADAVGSVGAAAGADTSSSTVYLVVFLILGIGGAVVSLIGGIRAYGRNSGAVALSVLGLLMQVGNLVAQCISVEGFSFVLSLCTIVSIVMLLVATILAGRRA